MVKELKEAISQVERLDDTEQKQIAKLLLEEMSWEVSFKNSQDRLSGLADEALQEFKSGKTIQTGW